METLELSRAELWFCAPDTPAIDEANLLTFRTGKAARRVLVRCVPSRSPSPQPERIAFELFLQEEFEDGRGAVLKRDGALFWDDAQRQDEKRWHKKAHKMLCGQMSRAWRPGDDSRFGVVVHNSGEGEVCDVESEPQHFGSTLFSWGERRSNEEFARWPQTEFDAHFERQFADENSSLRRTYEWQSLNDHVRTAHVTRCEYGSWDEMRSIAQCVLTLSFVPDREKPWIGGIWDGDVWDVLDESDPFRPHSPHLDEWAKTLCRVFRPLSCQAAPNYEQAHLGRLWPKIYPRYLESEPSAHQKLEAMLQLRDWLQTHAPDEVARLLDFSRPT